MTAAESACFPGVMLWNIKASLFELFNGMRSWKPTKKSGIVYVDGEKQRFLEVLLQTSTCFLSKCPTNST